MFPFRNRMVPLLIALIAIGSVRVCAQEQLYGYSQEDVSKVINDVVKSYAKNDAQKQELYKKVLTEAFARYWTAKEVIAPVGPGSIDELILQANTLSAELDSKGSPQIQIDSLDVLLKEYLSLKDTLALKNQTLAHKKMEIENIDKSIAQKDSELAQVKQQSQKLSQTQQILQQVAANLTNAYKKAQSMDDFSAVDVAQIDDVIEQYVSSRRSIEAFKTADVSALDSTVIALETLKTLKLLVNDALAAMAAKFNPTRNKTLIEDIRLQAAKPGSTPKQRELLTSIATSLQNQSQAYDSFYSILDSLENEYPCVPDQESRNSLNLNRYIIGKVQEFNRSLTDSNTGSLTTNSGSLTSYDARYVQLSRALNQLLEDLSPESKTPITRINTEEVYQSYLHGIAKSLK